MISEEEIIEILNKFFTINDEFGGDKVIKTGIAKSIINKIKENDNKHSEEIYAEMERNIKPSGTTTTNDKYKISY